MPVRPKLLAHPGAAFEGDVEHAVRPDGQPLAVGKRATQRIAVNIQQAMTCPVLDPDDRALGVTDETAIEQEGPVGQGNETLPVGIDLDGREAAEIGIVPPPDMGADHPRLRGLGRGQMRRHSLGAARGRVVRLGGQVTGGKDKTRKKNEPHPDQLLFRTSRH